MSGRVQAQVKVPSGPAPSFAPVQSGLLHRKSLLGGAPGLAGEFTDARMKRLVPQPLLVQTKLTVNQPNDRYEQEADRVAGQVMYTIGDASSRIFRQQKLVGESGLSSRDRHFDVSITGGSPLDQATRDYFEPRVGFVLGKVRIHDDKEADRGAAALDARAFTLGEHISFSAGAYSPGTTDGRRMLAHELTHVKQAYERRAIGASSVSRAGEPLELEADREAAFVEVPSRRALAPLSAPSIGTGTLILRTEIKMSSGNRVTDTNPAPNNNRREEVLALLHRLHTMESINIPNYSNQYNYVHSLVPRAQVPIDGRFRLTINAIRDNRLPSLPAQVIRDHMGVSVTDSVGLNCSNVRDDVLTVMNRLNFLFADDLCTNENNIVSQLGAGSSVPDSSLTETFSAITDLKEALAAGTLGIHPMHSDELQFGGADRFAAQTAVVDGDTIEVIPGVGATSQTFTKHFSVFVPRGALPNQNNVHLFFTPYDEPEGFVAEQGLRAQYDQTDWILIGVPGLSPNYSPNYVTISTDEITRCLTAAGRSTTINAIRMSAHSRGYRGLINTMMGRGGSGPLINLGLVQGVTVFDSSYRSLGDTLRSRRGLLTGMQAVQLYDVTVTNISGFPGTSFSPRLIRGLAYVRLVQEGLARGAVSQNNLSTSLTSNTLTATNNLLSVIPQRGTFSTRTEIPSGMTSLEDFLTDTDNRTDLLTVDDEVNGLRPFVVRNLVGYMSRSNDAHHWFVTELAHEAVPPPPP